MQQKAPEAITVMWYLLINVNIRILKVLKLLFSHGKIPSSPPLQTAIQSNVSNSVQAFLQKTVKQEPHQLQAST